MFAVYESIILYWFSIVVSVWSSGLFLYELCAVYISFLNGFGLHFTSPFVRAHNIGKTAFYCTVVC